MILIIWLRVAISPLIFAKFRGAMPPIMGRPRHLLGTNYLQDIKNQIFNSSTNFLVCTSSTLLVLSDCHIRLEWKGCKATKINSRRSWRLAAPPLYLLSPHWTISPKLYANNYPKMWQNKTSLFGSHLAFIIWQTNRFYPFWVFHLSDPMRIHHHQSIFSSSFNANKSSARSPCGS